MNRINVLLAALAVLAASGAIVACEGSSRAGPGTVTAPTTATAPVATENVEPTVAGAASFAYAEPDGTIWLMRSDGSERELIATPLAANAQEAAARIAWSPDGRSLAYRSADGKLKLLDVETGTETVLDAHDTPEDDRPMWSSSGEIAYLKKRAEHVYDL